MPRSKVPKFRKMSKRIVVPVTEELEFRVKEAASKRPFNGNVADFTRIALEEYMIRRESNVTSSPSTAPID